ncbi:MAG TPA: chemotaxis response regulator protein-glutamate methylesterase [Candidatus Dormibacteraeota bacterium]|nr:chemotaxis response regulator protein-glutamate methylesterase [Candidatus Dormibacteraeota bacterium]
MSYTHKPKRSDDSIHVLVVDDSAVVRQVMQGILSADPKIRVSVAADPIIAFAKIEKEPPDVVITDLVMPRMDGLTFLRKIMAERPLPVVVCSEVAHRRTEDAISALELGAVEVIKKPKLGVRDFLHESAVMLIDIVHSAAQAKVAPVAFVPVAPRNTADVILPLGPLPRRKPAGGKVIAVGASTGGTEALREFLQAMPADCPAIVIVQHMPEVFTRAFADRLNRDCTIEVKEAVNGDCLRNGRALIAPGNHHLLVRGSLSGYVAQVEDGPLVSRHRPSVDVLFRSVARAVGSHAVGVIMTGMGNDGAQGMLEMRGAGALTLAQDEASCVVFGMPKEAIARNAVVTVAPLFRLAETALKMAGC